MPASVPKAGVTARTSRKKSLALPKPIAAPKYMKMSKKEECRLKGTRKVAYPRKRAQTSN